MTRAVLVGDVGGTHSRWATFSGELGPVSIVRTCDSRGLADAVKGRVAGAAACGVAVAGPVRDGRVRLTNADWSGAEDDLGIPVALVNDLEAVALAVPALASTDVEWLTAASSLDESVLCLGIGTGFGGALWTTNGVQSMEPGHDSLGHFEPLGREVTVEEVVSGMAIRDMEQQGIDVSAVVPLAFDMALRRLIRRCNPRAILLMGGVVEGRRDLFAAAKEAGLPVGVIVHPFPALVGAAAAAMERLAVR